MVSLMQNVLKIQRLTRELAAALVAEFGPAEAARRLEHAAGEIRAAARSSSGLQRHRAPSSHGEPAHSHSMVAGGFPEIS